MKKTKRILSLVLSLMLLAVLCTACSGGDTNTAQPDANGENQTEEDANSAANPDAVTFRLATCMAIDDPVTLAAEEFAANVLERTEGRVVIDVYPANQLGDYLSVFDEIMRGTIDMAYAPPTDNYEPDIYLSYLPYLITDYSDIPAVYGKDGVLYQETVKLYENLGIKFMGYGAVGFLGIGATKEVVDENHDFITSCLIRTSSDLLSKLTIEGFGYNVSTMAYVDVFSGLQTGIIDGWLGGNPSINYFSFRDVIDYYYHFKVILENNHFYMGQAAFDKMSEEDQAIFLECADEMLLQSYEDAQNLDEQYLQELADFGIEVVEFTDEELAEMASMVREDIWPQIGADKYNEDLIEQISSSLE